jgi:hypothetical protein
MKFTLGPCTLFANKQYKWNIFVEFRMYFLINNVWMLWKYWNHASFEKGSKSQKVRTTKYEILQALFQSNNVVLYFWSKNISKHL